MRSYLWTVALLLLSSTPSFAHSQYISSDELIARDANANAQPEAESEFTWYSREKEERDLFKRKGGGGGGGRGGGGSSGGSSGGKGGGSGSGSSRYASGSHNSGVEKVGSGQKGGQKGAAADGLNVISLVQGTFFGLAGGKALGGNSGGKCSNCEGKSSSSSGKGGVTSSSSSTGGRTKSGSGPAPAYGGGRYYGGGAATPYSAGARSPLGIAPILLGVGILSIYPGLWLYGAYSYPYHNPYSFRNHSATRNNTDTTNAAVQTRQDSDTTGVNETRPVTCLCAAYSVCGCDDNGNTTFLDSIIGDGSYDALNKTLVDVADINGTTTIILNGTLPNGTTASGGTDSAAGRTIAEGLGWWVMIAVVLATCFAI